MNEWFIVAFVVVFALFSAFHCRGIPTIGKLGYILQISFDARACILEKAMFKYAEDEWTSKVPKTIEDAQKLVDVGFEYVCGFGSEGKLFRKRK